MIEYNHRHHIRTLHLCQYFPQRMVKKCGHRVILFDNKTNDMQLFAKKKRYAAAKKAAREIA
jgi:hypothetical protein